MQKKSIALIGKLPPPMGGVSIHVQRLYHWLKRESCVDVKVYSLNKSRASKGVEYVGNIFIFALRKLFLGFKEDVIHYHGANYFGLIVLSFIKYIHRDFKLILTVHSEGYTERLKNKPLLKKLIKLSLLNVDEVITGDFHIYDKVKSLSSDSNVSVVDAFLPPDKEEEKKLPLYIEKIFKFEGHIITANAYNVDTLKDGGDLYGLHILCELSTKLLKAGVHHRLVILISDINNVEYLNKIKADNESVFIISDQSVNGWQVLSKGDLMIRPTSTDGNAVSMKEAMLNGVPVIASDVVPRYEGVVTFSYPCVHDLFLKSLEILESKGDNTVCFSLSPPNYIGKYLDIYFGDERGCER